MKIASLRSYFKNTCNIAAWTLLGLVLVLTACAHTELPKVPAFVSDGQKHPGKIVWHDLVTPDLIVAKSFYKGLFGWTFDDVSSGYTLIRHDNHLIGGMAELNRQDKSAYWLPQMSVPNVDSAVKYTLQQQGILMLEPFNLSGRGKIAVVKDPEGAIFSIIESKNGDPVDHKVKLNEWLWNEVWTHNLNNSEAFYLGLVDYQPKVDNSNANHYHYLSFDGKPRIGFIALHNKDINPTWAVYIKVEDVQATLERVKALDGKVLMAPNQTVRHGTVAIITDPSGAGLVIQEWKP